MSVIYTTHAHVAGGRNGAGRTDDGQLDVVLSRPKEMGGEGAGTNPEQLFAVGYAACFEGALGAVARRRKIDLGATSIDSMVSLVALEDGTFRITVALDVDIPLVDDDALAVDLVEQAHLVCPYSNALRGNVDVALSVNGVWVAGPRG